MNENEQIFFLEINNFEFIFSVGENKENKNFKLIYQNSIPIKSVNDSKIIDFDLFFNLLKDSIYNIEQKLNLVLNNVILILDNFDCSLINFTGFKKLNGAQLDKENIIYILNSLKSKISEIEKNKNILHIFNSKYLLDKKKTENLPIGLFGNFYSHELSFFLIDRNDYKNIKNILKKCNLKIQRIISKKFIEGVYLINENLNLDTFFKIYINKDNSQILFFENSALKFIQNFKFGSDLIINDISKVIALNKDLVSEILSNSKFSEDQIENNYVEKNFFRNENFRKIKKKLIFEIAQSRIEELAELFLIKNVNLLSFLKEKCNVYINFEDKVCESLFAKSFKTSFSNRNTLELDFVEKVDQVDICDTALELVQFGWKKEALPVVQEKKSIIRRIFEMIFK